MTLQYGDSTMRSKRAANSDVCNVVLRRAQKEGIWDHRPIVSPMPPILSMGWFWVGHAKKTSIGNG
jgi:hypothetical protein